MKKFYFSLLLSIFSTAHADSLTGVREIDIVIEDLDADARNCGISNDLIDASIRIPISNSKIKLVNSQSSPYLYANVNAFSQGAYCVLSMRLEFSKYAISEKQVGTFWRKGQVAVWERNNAGRRVANEFESYAKQFIAAWLKAN